MVRQGFDKLCVWLVLSQVHLMFASYAEQTLIIFSLQVFWKQSTRFQFFPAWAYAAPTTLLRMPMGVIDSVVWSVIVYWLVGLAPEAGRYGLLTVVLAV